MAERYRERIDNSNDIFSSTDCTTIYIAPTHINMQNTHIKQTKFWHQESLDVFNHLINYRYERTNC